jgi:hypothetical protein
MNCVGTDRPGLIGVCISVLCHVEALAVDRVLNPLLVIVVVCTTFSMLGLFSLLPHFSSYSDPDNTWSVVAQLGCTTLSVSACSASHVHQLVQIIWVNTTAILIRLYSF